MIILRAVPSVVTQERFQLDFFVDGPSWEGFFDRLEVWRSRLADAGPYDPLHDDSWLPARIGEDGPASSIPGPSLALNGKSAQFLVGEATSITVTFSGVDPLPLSVAASQITAQSQGLLTAFVLADGSLAVQTVEPGVHAVLRVLGGEAAAILGLPLSEPKSVAFGRDARIILKHGEQNYSFVDPNGSSKYFYKARFYNSFTRITSDFSLPFQGTPVTGLDIKDLCRGVIDLVDMTGEPVCNQEVLLSSSFSGLQVDTRSVVGGRQRQLTDKKGHAEFLLVRGLRVTVSLGGTTLVRDVDIPSDTSVESISLLAPGVGTDDVFAVKQPNLPYASRRAL